MALQAVLFGLEGVLLRDSKGDQTTGLGQDSSGKLKAEVRKLFDFLRSKDVRPIIVANRNWTIRVNGQPKPLDEALKSVYGDLKVYVANRGDMPRKPQAAC